MGVNVREKNEGSGIWWVFARHKNRRKSWKIGTRKAANAFKEKIEAGLKLPKALIMEEEKNIPTFADFFADTMENETGIRESTRTSYEQNYNCYLKGAFGGLRLDQITSDTVEAFAVTLFKRGLAKDSCRLAVATLKKFMNEAIRKGHIQQNPVIGGKDGVNKKFKQAPVKREELYPLTHAETMAFLQAAVERSPYYYPLFLTAVTTGLRAGELVGLKWEDIDFHGKSLIVRRSISKGIEGPPKGSDRRRVELSDALVKLLRDLKDRNKRNTSTWVFCNQRGNHLDIQNVINRHFKPCLEKAELATRNFHQLRHTYASLRLNNGDSLWQVSKAMGHKDIRTTANIYGHIQPQSDRTALNRLPSVDSPKINNVVMMKKRKRA